MKNLQPLGPLFRIAWYPSTEPASEDPKKRLHQLCLYFEKRSQRSTSVIHIVDVGAIGALVWDGEKFPVSMWEFNPRLKMEREVHGMVKAQCLTFWTEEAPEEEKKKRQPQKTVESFPTLAGYLFKGDPDPEAHLFGYAIPPAPKPSTQNAKNT